MRLGSHIQILRNVYTTTVRPPYALAAPPSFKPIAITLTYPNRLYNSTLASTHTPPAGIGPDVYVRSTEKGMRMKSPSYWSHETHAVMIQLVASASGSRSTPMQEYQKLVEAGALRSDDYQTRIIQKLQGLHDALAVYDPPPPAETLSLVNL